MNLLLGLACAFAAEGAEVLFAVPSELAGYLPPGIRVLEGPVSVADLRRQSEHDIVGFLELSPDMQAFEMFSRTWPLSVLNCIDNIRSECFDLLVHEEGDHAAPLAATAAGLPRVCVEWPCPPRSPQLIERIDSRIKSIASDLCIRSPAMANVAVTTAPPAFRTPGYNAVPAVVRTYMRSVTLDPPLGPVPGLEVLPCERTVHATLGTIPGNYRSTGLLELIAGALEDQQLNLVLTTGNLAERIDVPSRPGLYIARHIPHRDLLPMCAAVICHGGVSTTMEALGRGIPLIILPIGGASQKRMAGGCVSAHVGVALHTEQLTVHQLRGAVARILDDTSYSKSASRMAGDIAAMPSAATVASGLIRQFVD